MKNPFSKIGKVIKYEFKHSSRIVFPLYAVLLVLGLLTGLSVNPNKYKNMVDSMNSKGSFEYRVEGAAAATEMLSGFLALAVIIFAVTITVITIVTIARRFEQGMLGEEAYLNLSLPVTMGQQLWGRMIINLCFMLLCAAAICVTFILCFIRMNVFEGIRSVIQEINLHTGDGDIRAGTMFWIGAMIYFCGSCWLISLIFVVTAISHLLKNNKGFIKFIIIVALLWLNGKVLGLIPSPSDLQFSIENARHILIRNSCMFSGILLVLSAVYFGFTQFVFTKKLNLE